MTLLLFLMLGVAVALLAGYLTGRAAGGTDLAAGGIAGLIGAVAASMDSAAVFGHALPLLLTTGLGFCLGAQRAIMERTDRWFVEDRR